MQPFDAIGFWYLENKPDQHIAGTLHYTFEDGLRLSLIGTFDANDVTSGITNKYEIVHGIVNKSPFGKFITLTNGFTTQKTHSLPGFSTETILFNRAYIGEVCLKKNDILFSAAKIEFNSLFEWLGITGINVQHQKDTNFNFIINYNSPYQIKLKIKNSEVIFWIGSHLNQSHGECSIQEHAQIIFHGFPPVNDEEIYNTYVYPMQCFLTLASGKPCTVTNFQSTCLVKENTSQGASGNAADVQIKQPHNLNILYQPINPKLLNEKTILGPQMLFNYGYIVNIFSSMLPRWYDWVWKNKVFCNIYFSLLWSPPNFIDLKYTNVLTAIKMLLAENSIDLKCDRIEYGDFLEKQSGLYRQWIESMLPNQQEIYFPINLHKSLEKHKKLMSPLTQNNFDEFINHVIMAEQSFIRRNSQQTSSCISPENLHWLIEKINILITKILFSNMGFTDQDADKLLMQSPYYDFISKH